MKKVIKDKRREAYNRIREFILTYKIKPGQRLDHEYLRKEIGVSTTPIREALNRLMEEGFIFQIKNRGYFVSDLSIGELEDLYEVREALEVFAATKTLKEGLEITEAFRTELEQTMDLYYKYAHEEPYRNRLMLDQEFHVDLAKLANNSLLSTKLENIFEKVNYKRKVVELHPQRGQEASEEHYKILNLFLEGNKRRLIERLQGHIRKGKEGIVGVLRAREENMRL
ncbi:MAG: GntR family transcriptional regulator [Desulfobacteraceae bacterium]|nr:GntR family transcriptional regulator [Desulfobacteraceae bacterium]